MKEFFELKGTYRDCRKSTGSDTGMHNTVRVCHHITPQYQCIVISLHITLLHFRIFFRYHLAYI